MDIGVKKDGNNGRGSGDVDGFEVLYGGVLKEELITKKGWPQHSEYCWCFPTT